MSACMIGVSLDQLDGPILRAEVDERFEDDVTDVWNYETSVESRDALGGTSRRAVLEQVTQMRQWLAEQRALNGRE